MATGVIRFEAFIPPQTFGSADYNAVTTFINNMDALPNVKMYYYPVVTADGLNQATAYFGYITSAQQATALGYLNTLNGSLSTGPVTCVVWGATTEP